MAGKTDSLGFVIEGQGLVAGNGECRRRMFAVGARIGQALDINNPNIPVPVGPEPYGQPHGMTAGGAAKGLRAFIHDNSRFAGLQSDDSGKHFHSACLLAAEAAADARLDNPYPAGRKLEGSGQLPTDVKRYLGGADDNQPPRMVLIAESAVGFHHGVGLSLGIVGFLDDDITLAEFGLHIACFYMVAAADILVSLHANRKVAVNIILAMNDGGMLRGRFEVENGLIYLVIHFDKFQGFLGRFFINGGDNSHLIAHIAHNGIKDEPVVRRRFGIRLSRQGEANLGHVAICENGLHAGQLEGLGNVNIPDAGKGMGTAQYLDRQGIGRHHILGVDRLTGSDRQRIDFRNTLADDPHLLHPQIAFNGPQLSHIPCAAAQVARQIMDDLLFRRIRQFPFHGQNGHDKSGTAETTLVCSFGG